MKIIVFSVLMLFFNGAAHASHKERTEGNQHKVERHDKESERFSLAPYNETYAAECGACHLPYPPGLLPSESWRKIIALLPAHFDDDVQIDKSSLTKISEHLNSYSGFNSSKGRERKNGDSKSDSLRITENHFFRKEHHELNQKVFSRISIGSPSNCKACHSSADIGLFDEHQVSIPIE